MHFTILVTVSNRNAEFYLPLKFKLIRDIRQSFMLKFDAGHQSDLIARRADIMLGGHDIDDVAQS